MRYSIITPAVGLATLVAAQQPPNGAWSQCGGIGYTGNVVCPTAAGYVCSTLNPYYAQCVPGSATSTARTTATTLVRTTTTTTTTTRAITSAVTTRSMTTARTSTTTSSSVAPSATSLDKLIKQKGKNYLGVAVERMNLEIPGYGAIVKSEFGSITAEWSMKWTYIQPSRGTFNWDNADYLVNWAIQNNKNVRGHTFIWHGDTPSWVTAITNPAELRQVITDHITRYASRYAGKIEVWDVVNEAVDDDGTWRKTHFYNVLGLEYIELAFRAARAADPHAKLCYNDYNLDWNNAKVSTVIGLINDLKAKGVPIDCIGSQAHLVVSDLPYQNLESIWGRLATETGLELQLTELDIRMYTPETPQKLADQRAAWATAIKACMKIPRCTSITVWGVTDGLSWVPSVFPDQGSALIWDASYQKKPAYAGVVDGINSI